MRERIHAVSGKVCVSHGTWSAGFSDAGGKETRAIGGGGERIPRDGARGILGWGREVLAVRGSHGVKAHVRRGVGPARYLPTVTLTAL